MKEAFRQACRENTAPAAEEYVALPLSPADKARLAEAARADGRALGREAAVFVIKELNRRQKV